MLSVNSNPIATHLASVLNNISERTDRVSQQIATGKRINSAADDPAGLAIVNRLKADLGGFNMVEKNISHGLSLLEVADTGLQGVQSTLSTMRELAVQAANGTLATSDRQALQDTFGQLQTQVDEIVNDAELFGQNLIGASAASVDIQTDKDASGSTTLNTAQSDGSTLGVDSGSININDVSGAQSAITAIDSAIDSVSASQAVVGAQTSGLDTRLNTVKSLQVNLEDARGRIEDLDMARASADLQKLQTQQQLGISMLGLVSSYPSYALGLLR